MYRINKCILIITIVILMTNTKIFKLVSSVMFNDNVITLNNGY